jgi:hypothetical protein
MAGYGWATIDAFAASFATVPDGPSLSWSGGEYERIEAKNRAALKEIDQAEFTEPE